MARYSRSDRQLEVLLKGGLLLLIVLALAVGGVAHFAQAMIAISILAAGAIFAAGILIFTWTRRSLQTTTKAAVTLFTASAIVIGAFIVAQPPIEWPATDVRITGIHNEGGRIHVSGLVFGGLFPESITLDLPAGTDLPGANHDLRIYRNPDDPSRISTQPVINKNGFVHFGYLVAAALAIVGGGACSYQSVQNRDNKRHTGVAARVFAPVPTQSPPALSQPDALRQIDWYQFEKLMAHLLTLEGHQIARIGGARADGGIDILAEKLGEKTIIQCKHWRSQADVKLIRELVGTRAIHGADHVILATLNPPTQQAQELARAQSVGIVTETDLLGRMQVLGAERFQCYLDPNDKRCPVCDAVMVRRDGRRGPFWGCSQYGWSRCPGKIEI